MVLLTLLMHVFTAVCFLARLKQKLHERRDTRSASPSQELARRNSAGQRTVTPPTSSSGHSSKFSNVSSPRVSLGAIVDAAQKCHATNFDGVTGSPNSRASDNDHLSELMFSGWEPDLPNPATLGH